MLLVSSSGVQMGPGNSGGALVNFEVTGIGGLVVLALDVWAIVSIFGSSASTGKKVLWILLVLLLPLVGFILWLLLGPRSR